MNNPVKSIGFWSAILSLIFGLGYSLSQLLSWLKFIPIQYDQFWLFLPSLFLAPSFLVTIICLHYSTTKELRLWSAIGQACAIVYCAFATLNYFVQLTVVIPALQGGRIDESHILFFKPGSFMFAMDCLGYFFMSLSCFFTAFAFRQTHKRLYSWMLINGLLIIIFIPAYFNPVFYFIGSVWAVSFSLAMINAARLFHKPEKLSFKIKFEI